MNKKGQNLPFLKLVFGCLGYFLIPILGFTIDLAINYPAMKPIVCVFYVVMVSRTLYLLFLELELSYEAEKRESFLTKNKNTIFISRIYKALNNDYQNKVRVRSAMAFDIMNGTLADRLVLVGLLLSFALAALNFYYILAISTIFLDYKTCSCLLRRAVEPADKK